MPIEVLFVMNHRGRGRNITWAGIALLCGVTLTASAAMPPLPLVQGLVAAQETQNPVRATAQALNADNAYRVALLKMKAHLRVAGALMKQGAPGAREHLREPIREIFSTISGQLKPRRATITADIVQQLTNAAESGSELTLQSAYDTLLTAVDSSVARTGPMSRQAVLEISRALFRDAVESYRQSVSAHTIVDVLKYRSGAGLAAVAGALIRRAKGSDDPQAYERLLAAVALLREAWPSVLAPRIAYDSGTVTEWLSGVESAIDAMSV